MLKSYIYLGQCEKYYDFCTIFFLNLATLIRLVVAHNTNFVVAVEFVLEGDLIV